MRTKNISERSTGSFPMRSNSVSMNDEEAKLQQVPVRA
jgi:hypothetical protein